MYYYHLSKTILLRSMVALFLFSSLLVAQEIEKLKPIVSAEWLNKNLKNTNIRIIDLRDENDFMKSHIRGAVNIPALKNLFGENFFMPPLENLRILFSNAGIDSNTHVVAYDNGDFIWSARLYWILQTLGHQKVSILDVGFSHQEIKKIPTTTVVTKTTKKEFVPRVDNSKLETKLGTLVSIGNKTIIDGRKKTHYDGIESKAQRYGHIPTALNYACTQNYEVTKDGSKMKDLKTLAEVYKDIPKDKEIILYCDGGAEAALNYVVLQELGYKAAVYDGSWIEWGNDKNVPIKNPSNK
ncbi:MAG: sulfurtransferase [Arcobacteraceae bacterium]